MDAMREITKGTRPPFFNINVKITIDSKIVIYNCKSIQIEQSVQVLTFTARIELPREFYQAVNSVGKNVNFARKNILEHIKIGSTVKIELGYNQDLQTEFQGYITKIDADIPLILECEDEMYKLKNAQKITKHVQSGSLSEILQAIIPSKYTINLGEEYSFGLWVIDNARPYEVLEELQEKVGIRAYFENKNTLHVGMTVDFKPQISHKYNFNNNVRATSELKFQQSQEKKLEVTINSKQSNGGMRAFSMGEAGGDTKTLSIPNLSQEQMRLWAEKIYESRQRAGFLGTLSGWCYPRTKAGESLEIVRPYYQDKHQDGRYFIESVQIIVSETDGIVRKNTITHRLQ